MFIRLFDIESGKVIPSEHCYVISWLKEIFTEYPLNHDKVFTYLQYMSSRDPQNNPYLLVSEEEREESILHDIDADFSTEDETIITALANCRKLTDTPKYKSWRAGKIALERLNKYLENTIPTSGKDGSNKDIRDTLNQMPVLQSAYNKLEMEMLEETKSMSRGGKDLGYEYDIKNI